jgi:hypothetical protein
LFFHIGRLAQENFSHWYQLGQFHVSTDAGWHTIDVDHYKCVYKGYVDTCAIDSAIEQIIHDAEPQLFGNFCALVYNSHTNSIKIKSDRLRGFPIWFDEYGVTNLYEKTHTAWTDSLLEIKHDGQVVESKFNAIGLIDTSPVTVDEVFEFIDQRLCEKTQNFLQYNTLPIRAFLSGGVDSLLVYSYLQRFTTKFDMVKCNHIDYDRFWLKNSGSLKKRWGYSQIHHWNTPCVLTSGTPGDEFMLRSPTTVDLYLKLHGYNMSRLLEQPEWLTCLHHTYFNRDKNRKIFDSNDALPSGTQYETIWTICNILLNDWQHWHLGHTLTWTPLRDLEIIKYLLRLPPELALGQIMNSEISCRLIENNCPTLTQVISKQKNSGNYMENLVDFYLNTTDKSGQ